MRILKTVQSYFPFQSRGGPVFKVRALARSLAQRGHDITVLTADLGFTDTNSFGMNIVRCRWGWHGRESGVEALYLSTLAHYRALTLNPSVVGFCSDSLRNFDLVHFYGLYDLLGPAVSHFCRRHGIPYVIEPMGMYRPIDRSFRLKRFWHRSIGGAFWRQAARIVATSEMEQQELMEDGIATEKLTLRYNGIDAHFREPQSLRGSFRTQWGIPPGEPLILFLGRLIPRKGADILIEAFAEACPESGRLVIAGPQGEPGYLEYLRNCARNSGEETRILFPGPLYDDGKTAVLADADILALPSRYENFANVAAEAIAFDVPVVISESCGIRSLIAGRAGLVVPAEKKAFACALKNMIHDKVLYSRLKNGCHDIAKQLSWDHLAEQMERIYAVASTESHERR
jgi:glycosyltransferase involved in cell wall biosynthesis